jgi:cytidine deaminase
MTDSDREQLIELAIESRSRAYAPYSNFLVGAANKTTDGTIFTGCNVENTSYGLSICAERTAICTAVSAGYQEFEMIAVAATPFATPCGACRQFIIEFGQAIEVICVDADDPSQRKSWTSEQLIPENFRF